MEARLGAAFKAEGREVRDETPSAPVEDVGEAVAAAAASEGAPNAWPDESAESAMLSELRERGEKPGAGAATEPVEEIDPKALPPLSELVNRLSPEVREALDDLFRAKFVTVRRLPQKALTK